MMAEALWHWSGSSGHHAIWIDLAIDQAKKHDYNDTLKYFLGTTNDDLINTCYDDFSVPVQVCLDNVIKDMSRSQDIQPTPQKPSVPDDQWSDDRWNSGKDKWLRGESIGRLLKEIGFQKGAPSYNVDVSASGGNFVFGTIYKGKSLERAKAIFNSDREIEAFVKALWIPTHRQDDTLYLRITEYTGGLSVRVLDMKALPPAVKEATIDPFGGTIGGYENLVRGWWDNLTIGETNQIAAHIHGRRGDNRWVASSSGDNYHALSRTFRSYDDLTPDAKADLLSYYRAFVEATVDPFGAPIASDDDEEVREWWDTLPESSIETIWAAIAYIPLSLDTHYKWREISSLGKAKIRKYYKAAVLGEATLDPFGAPIGDPDTERMIDKWSSASTTAKFNAVRRMLRSYWADTGTTVSASEEDDMVEMYAKKGPSELFSTSPTGIWRGHINKVFKEWFDNPDMFESISSILKSSTYAA